MPPQRRQAERAHLTASPIARPRRLRSHQSKSPKPSPSASQDEDRILKIIAAIFWDINAYTLFEKVIAWNPTAEDLRIHQNFWGNTLNFLDKAFWEHANQQFQDALSLRCAEFIRRFGWKFFAICAHAESFLFACKKETDDVFTALKQILAREERCLEVFARTRGLKWQMPLLSLPSDRLPGFERLFAPEIDLTTYHPSQIVLTENGGLRLARFQGKTQLNIEKSFYNRSPNYYGPDPSLRVTGRGSFWKCMDRGPCSCVSGPAIGDLIQLTEYPNRGIGIRALTNIKAGDALGEFIGEIIPRTDTSYTGSIYDIVLLRQAADSEPEIAGWISPTWRGNWVRFINHSCESSTEFINTFVGKRITILVKALRDIPIFEEITVNYGEQYWTDKQCLCGSAICIFRKAQESQESGNPIVLSLSV